MGNNVICGSFSTEIPVGFTVTDQFSTSKVSPPRNLGPFKPTTSVKLQHLNSPTTLLAKTTEKMRLLAQDSMKSQPQENLTPERAEFECFRGTVEPGGQEDEVHLLANCLQYSYDKVLEWTDSCFETRKLAPTHTR